MLGEGDGCQGGEGQHMRRSSGDAAPVPYTRPLRGRAHVQISGSTLKICPGNISLQKYSLFHFPHEEQRQHIQAGICLKLGFIPIFHLERYLHVCLTKCGITHLIKISDMLKLLDELGH